MRLSPELELSSSPNINGIILPHTTTISTRFNPLQLNGRNGHVNPWWKLPFPKNSTTFQMMLGAWMTNHSIHHQFIRTTGSESLLLLRKQEQQQQQT
jgi:hypothetical protein